VQPVTTKPRKRKKVAKVTAKHKTFSTANLKRIRYDISVTWGTTQAFYWISVTKGSP